MGPTNMYRNYRDQKDGDLKKLKLPVPNLFWK